MKSISLKESIEQLKFLKSESLAIANEQEKIALENDVILFETPKDKEKFIDGFVNGACWQKGRGDAKCVDFAEFLKGSFEFYDDAVNDRILWELAGTEQRYTSEEMFAEYDKGIKTF